jgi:HPt (histidine-containing phosphotransfer) domain-containing protein
MQVPVELKKKYLERRIEDIQFLIASLEKNDFEPALKLGHQVKGNAVTFDFPQIATFGQQIEMAAKNQNKEELKSLAFSMATEIDRARETYH